jgi:PAS domain S-box-containing protein
MNGMAKKHILLVEDEPIIALGRKTALEKYGYSVITANTGENAVEIFKSDQEIDLILMDIDLGYGIDGTEATASILKERNVPVVLLSSHTEAEIVKKTETITSYGFVVKNSGITVLDASIKMAFKLFEAHRKLEEEKEHLKTTLNSIGDAVITTDTKGCITRMNPVAELLTGWEIEEALGMPIGRVFTIFNAVTRMEVESPVVRVLAEGTTVELDKHTILIDKSGREYQISDSGAPIKNGNGKITGAVLIFRDVSDEYFTQESMRLRESYLSAIIENQPGHLWLKDVEGRFLTANTKFLHSLGFEKVESLIGKTDFDLCPRELAVQYAFDDSAVMKSQKTSRFEDMTEKEDGLHWYETYKSPVLDKTGILIGTTGYSRDITERKRTEAEIKKKNTELKTLNEELNSTIEKMEAVNEELVETNMEQAATDENLWHTMDVLRKNETQLRTTQEATISSMAILSEFRDTDTGLHILRTKMYVKLMLEKMGSSAPYSADIIELIWHSAPLHDIGKVAIPDYILLKPGKLTDAEFEVMKKHTQYGSDAIKRTQLILAENSFLNIAGEIAEFHHEKWDGSGYPHGLKGEAIPLSARIMAIADVYDACISERPYKAPIPHAEVVKIIHDGSGTHFDPVLVRLFEENHEEFNLIGQGTKELA